ncbi:hypothetical protein GCM10010977_22870 [Citricoccus zhacaiensis]|uniref:DUF4191 domain-containing protein n=1 Tax=Citricoccus zhacaiensis TaxID=489142 RepID=A0ABQ2M500_9MICC|nr:DUF4191 domain-containing protein [Citricoccus zhacaiensis]GGO46877.1 hypothetical protein GCM10010977_22870 [Citricoccus zhacaiensis]
MAKSTDSAASSSQSTRESLRAVKAAQKERRQQEKIRAKGNKAETKARKKATKKPGVFKQLREVFSMTRAHDPKVVLWMALAFVGALVVGLVVGLLLNNWITWLLIAIPFGLLAAVIIMNRMAERAAFARIDGRPGAAGAALSTLRRGWIVPEQPVAVSPKTQDAVFRAVGRPGVVLITEGPTTRVRPLVEKERKNMQRFLPNVPIQVLATGHGADQVELHDLAKTLKRMKKTLTKQEVQAVDKRLNSLGSAKMPIPKGIDPYRARPDRKAMRGR